MGANMRRFGLIAVAVALVAACQAGAAPTAQIVYVTPDPATLPTPQIVTAPPQAAPTPQVIYVTAPPQTAPTPQIVYVTPEPTAPPTPGTEEPVTVKGTGTKATGPFDLAGGDYVVSWTIEASSSVGCYHSATLKGLTDTSYYEGAGRHSLDDKGPFSDTTNLYAVPAGRFYVDVNSGCDWTITIAR